MDSSKVVCSPSTVQAHPGQDVVLSCRVEPPFDLTRETLEWKHGTTGFMHVYRSGRDNYDEQDERFKNRTILNHQNLKDGNVSLTLTNFTMKDEGTYTFCLRTQEPFMYSDVTLTKSSSKVVCSPSIVQAFLGQDVVLSCRVKPPFDLTNETLEWKHGKEDVRRYPSLWDYLDHQYSRFFNRTFLNHPNLKDGIASLTLTNFTNQDEGNYSFCLPELLSCSDVTLTERSDLSFVDYSAIVGGVFGVFGVLGVFGAVVGGILAFLRSRNRNRHRTDHHPESASIPLRWCKDPRHSICGSQNPPEPELQQMESNCPPGDCFRNPGQGQQDRPRGSQSPQSQRAGGHGGGRGGRAQRRAPPMKGAASPSGSSGNPPASTLFSRARTPRGNPPALQATTHPAHGAQKNHLSFEHHYGGKDANHYTKEQPSSYREKPSSLVDRCLQILPNLCPK